MNTRLIAADVINKVSDGQSLADCLEPALQKIKEPRDKAFVQALCYGVCRFYTRLDVILSFLLKKPMKAKDSDVHALLLTGLYQLTDTRVPPHAAVSETVNASEKLKKPWARGLVNAVLREYLRKKNAIESEIEKDPEAAFAHPEWWVNAVKNAYPDNWEAILKENNAHPPFVLRVNKRKLSREAYLQKLAECKFEACIVPETSQGIMLDSPVPVEQLPGFAMGEVSVQDAAAQLAADLLDIKAEQRVLDACAAPGGKLTHILELEPQLSSVQAVEQDSRRIKLIKENLARLQLKADCICADAADVKSWWDGKPFDRILLDAPCSASGVIRRHPDIKLLREESDIPALANTQLHLLESLWPLLAPGGILLYATCSIFPEENTSVLQQFLAAHPDAAEDKINADWGISCDVGRQILPGMHGMDGFYYARLAKGYQSSL